MVAVAPFPWLFPAWPPDAASLQISSHGASFGDVCLGGKDMTNSIFEGVERLEEALSDDGPPPLVRCDDDDYDDDGPPPLVQMYYSRL